MAHMLRQGIASAVVCIFGVLTVAVADAQTVKLGVLTPLSVPGDANAGKLIVRGARLGEEYVNTVMGGMRGGQKIELRIEDDTGVPEKGVSGYRKLVTQDEVVVVLGQYHSSVMLAVQKLADKMGTPVFSTQASNKNITLNQYATTFRTHAIDSDRVTLWLGFIKGQGYKRVALIAENTDYGLGLIEDTKEQNQEMGLSLALKPVIFDRASVDMTAQLLDVKAWGPDLVINAGNPPGALVMIKQAYDVGLFPKVPMLASFDFPIRPEYWEAVGDKGNWMLYIAYYHPTMKKTRLGDWFAERYRALYNEPAVYTAFNAFGQVVFISEAIDKAQSTKPEDVIASLESGSFLSWNGSVKFERGAKHWHQWSPPMMILQHTQPNQNWETAKIIYPPDMKTGELMTPR
jgi:branched-chain amino acid transport system substrate-binding protein